MEGKSQKRTSNRDLVQLTVDTATMAKAEGGCIRTQSSEKNRDKNVERLEICQAERRAALRQLTCIQHRKGDQEARRKHQGRHRMWAKEYCREGES